MMTKKITNIFFTTVLAINVLTLVGCAAVAKLDVNSVSYLNPDIDGKASPVMVTVYQLKNSYNFSQADYQSLTSNAAKVLGEDIIDKNSFPVKPAANFTFSEKVYPNTKFIGVVAAYRDPDSVSWHKVVKLKKVGGSVKIHLNLESAGITVK